MKIKAREIIHTIYRVKTENRSIFLECKNIEEFFEWVLENIDKGVVISSAVKVLPNGKTPSVSIYTNETYKRMHKEWFAAKELESYYSYVLEDDSTPYGGVAFSGETLRDFIETSGERFTSLKEVNVALKECGIRPIQKGKR